MVFLNSIFEPNFIQRMYKAFLALPIDEKLILGCDLPEKLLASRVSDWAVWVRFFMGAVLSLGFLLDTYFLLAFLNFFLF